MEWANWASSVFPAATHFVTRFRSVGPQPRRAGLSAVRFQNGPASAWERHEARPGSQRRRVRLSRAAIAAGSVVRDRVEAKVGRKNPRDAAVRNAPTVSGAGRVGQTAQQALLPFVADRAEGGDDRTDGRLAEAQGGVGQFRGVGAVVRPERAVDGGVEGLDRRIGPARQRIDRPRRCG